MNRDDFRAAIRRLVLFAAAATVALALWLVGTYLGLEALAAAFAGGVVIFFAATVDVELESGEQPPARPPEPTRRQVEARRERLRAEREEAA